MLETAKLPEGEPPRALADAVPVRVDRGADVAAADGLGVGDATPGLAAPASESERHFGWLCVCFFLFLGLWFESVVVVWR